MSTDLDPPPAGDILDTPEAGRRVVRGGAIRTGGFVLGTLVSVGGAALVTRHLGPDDYGRYSQVLGLVSVVQIVTDAGMGTLATREYAQRRGADRERLLAVILGLRIALSLIGVAVAVLVGLALGYDGAMLLGAALTGVGLLVLVMQGTYAIPLNAEIRMVPVTLLDLLRQALLAAGFVVLVLVGTGIVPFLALTIPVHAVLLAVTVPLVGREVSPRPKVDRRAWLDLLKPALVFSLADAVGVIYSYTALIVCGLVASDTETGLFAASFRVFIILIVVPGLLMTTAFPLLARSSRDDRDRFRNAILRLNEVGALIGGLTAVTTVLAAPAILAIVAGAEFADAVGALRIQGLSLAMSFVIAPWGFALLAGKDQRALLIGNGLALVLSASAVLLLAGRYGATGAAVGTAVGELSLAFSYSIGLARGADGMRALSPRALRCLPGLGLGLAVAALGLPAVPAAALGAAVYVVCALALRAVPPELGQLLPARLKPLVGA